MNDKLREALDGLYELPMHRHPAPMGVPDMPQDCVMLRDVEVLIDRALAQADAIIMATPEWSALRAALVAEERERIARAVTELPLTGMGHDIPRSATIAIVWDGSEP